VSGTGFVIAAPQSGSGKTLITLSILKALSDRGFSVRGCKVGPDYIDPAFHAAACNAPSFNLDLWAMGAEQVRALAGVAAFSCGILVVEGVMGLFDGASISGSPDGTPDRSSGSTADVARDLGLPIILVVDVARQAASVAALVHGFNTARDDTRIAGVILNRVGSARHEQMLRRALEPLGIPIVGGLPVDARISVPSRHLGLVQADEHPELESFLSAASALAETHIDMDRLIALSTPVDDAGSMVGGLANVLPPLGQRVAVASDMAFRFAYPHLLEGWRQAGAELSFFSPLADEAPAGDADAVFLPGGYPELHAGRLAGASGFRAGMYKAAERGAPIYGECGGYMTLGEGLIDGDGVPHRMLGLLPLSTSFAEPKRHLGYRVLTPAEGLPWPAAWSTVLTGHEFHYASTVSNSAPPLFSVTDAAGEDLGATGAYVGRVLGSFCHVISRG